jgi:hypothetical protein
MNFFAAAAAPPPTRESAHVRFVRKSDGFAVVTRSANFDDPLKARSGAPA